MTDVLDHLTTRRADIQTTIEHVTKQIQRLDEVRTQGIAELNYLRGAFQVLDELIEEFEKPEPSAPAGELNDDALRPSD